MPPKDKGAPVPQPPPEDPDPYGFFLVVDVSSANLFWDGLAPVEGEEAAEPAVPSVSASIEFPGVEYIFKSEPTALNPETGLYSFSFSKKLRQATDAAALHTLLNTDIKVGVADVTGLVLAAGEVDLLQFGMGASLVEAASVALTAATLPPEYNGPMVQPDSTVSARVSLIQVSRPPEPAPPAEPAEGAESEPPPEAPPAPTGPITAPFTFVTEHDAEFCNVITIKMVGASPLPPTLEPVLEAAAGRVAVSVGLVLPSGPEIACGGGQIKEGVLTWSRCSRVFLTPEATKALQWHLEDGKGLWLEVGRTVAPPVDRKDTELADPANEVYHGAAPVDAWRDFLKSGNTEVRLSGPVSSSWAAAAAANSLKPTLPPYTAPAKGKSIEDLPAGLAPGSCYFCDAGTVLEMQVSLARPLIPAWSPPPPPEKSMAELIPPRDLNPAPEPTTAADEFRSQVKTISSALAKEYMMQFPEDGARAVAEGGNLPEDVVHSRHRSLTFELNRSGKYMQLKDALRSAVVGVVREKFKKSGDMDSEELQGLYHDLYVMLVDEMRCALDDITDLKPKPPSKTVSPEDLMRLKALADENEAAGNIARADTLHMMRLPADPNPQVWYDYGAFLLRCQQHGRAEECLKEALAIAPSHTPSLTALTLLLIHQAQVTDPLYLNQAESAASALNSVLQESPLAWALLALVYLQGGDAKKAAYTSCHAEVGRLGRELSAISASPSDANGYMQVVGPALEVHLPNVATLALQQAQDLRPSAAQLTVELALGQAHVAVLELGRVVLEEGDAAALSAVREAEQRLGTYDPRPHVLYGDVHFQAGRMEDAARAYQAAMQRGGPGSCELRVHLRLGAACQAMGQMQAALDVYTTACSQYPCASAWLGVGQSYLALALLDEADMAFSEANILDPDHSGVWGHLALTALRAGRLPEAEQALKYGIKASLNDADLLLAIAQEWLDIGQAARADAAGQLSLKAKDTYQVRMLLGQVALRTGDVASCRDHVGVAMGMAATDEERAAAAQLEGEAYEATLVE